MQEVFARFPQFVESIIKCRRNRYGFACIIFLSEGRRKEVKTLNGYSYLTLEQRREIERMYAEGERVVDIAARLKRSAAAIYEELKRGYTGEFDGYARPKYSADLAQATVQENFRRRGNRRGANC
ncbi:MAG: helix-turn-helix domain-containing protein [Oscillospiraceae bacterium]